MPKYYLIRAFDTTFSWCILSTYICCSFPFSHKLNIPKECKRIVKEMYNTSHKNFTREYYINTLVRYIN